MSNNTEQNDGYQQAKGQYESIAALVDAANTDFDQLEALRDKREILEEAVQDAVGGGDTLRVAKQALYAWESENLEDMNELISSAGDYKSQEEAEEALFEKPLDVQVRSDWTAPGAVMEAGEFRILLCMGGPTVQVRGELENGTPTRAWIEYFDWGGGRGWVEYADTDPVTLLGFAQRFFP